MLKVKDKLREHEELSWDLHLYHLQLSRVLAY
jgi:hypothetical protein